MRKESKLMSLGKVLNSLRSSHEIVEVHDGDTIFHFTFVHTGNLEIWLIHENSSNMPNLVDFRGQPRLNQNDSTWEQMVPAPVAQAIKKRSLFGYAASSNPPLAAAK